jgi:hypothetical protein
VRAVATSVVALVLVGGLAGCTQTIAGTAGPRPTVSGGGDFSSGSDTPTDAPTDSSTDQPTDTGTDIPTDVPTDVPTGLPTDGDSASIDTLCSRLDYATKQGTGVDSAVIRSYVSTMILVWGIANSDDSPYAKADAATTKACPDTRTAVLKLMNLPDLKSTEK